MMDDNDDDEPLGMSGALSSGRSGGSGGKKKKKDEGCSEWRRKDDHASKKSSKKERKSKEKKGKVDVTFGGMGSVSAAISASAYYKDVGKKGLKKRKHTPADQLNAGFDMPLTKEEKKRRKERQVSNLWLLRLRMMRDTGWLVALYAHSYGHHFPSFL